MPSELGLVAAGAGVGLGHAILPDHWLPLAVVARSERISLRRVLRLSSLAGLAHVTVSVVLGGLIIAVGLPFRSRVEDAESAIVGTLLLLTGLAFGVLELIGRGHGHIHLGGGHHHDHEHDHPHPERDHAPRREGHGPPRRGRLTALASIAVPFGAAASPDLTILPVFLAAAVVGAGPAALTLAAFAVITVATMVGLTLAATAGALSLRAAWLDRFGNLITAAVLIVIGVLVLAGIL